jgi:hypothetical protein
MVKEGKLDKRFKCSPEGVQFGFGYLFWALLCLYLKIRSVRLTPAKYARRPVVHKKEKWRQIGNLGAAALANTSETRIRVALPTCREGGSIWHALYLSRSPAIAADDLHSVGMDGCLRVVIVAQLEGTIPDEESPDFVTEAVRFEMALCIDSYISLQ